MSVGDNWLGQGERAGREQARRMLDGVEREVRGVLPGAAIERGADEVRIAAVGLFQKWLADPALRFLLWSAK